MFTWNESTPKPTDQEIAFDITDLLFSGADAKRVEREILKVLKEKRYETINWLIDECRDRIADLRIRDQSKEKTDHITMLINSLERYKEDVKAGYVPNNIIPVHQNHDDDPWIVLLIGLIISFWCLMWILI